MQPMHTEGSPDQHQAPTGGSSANRIDINLGGPTLLVVLLLATVIGACGVVMGLNLSRQQSLEARFLDLDRQYRMTELKLDDWTVVAHRSGLVLPGDYTRGPQGNLDAESFRKGK
jgi:hypothetical protein